MKIQNKWEKINANECVKTLNQYIFTQFVDVFVFFFFNSFHEKPIHGSYKLKPIITYCFIRIKQLKKKNYD